MEYFRIIKLKSTEQNIQKQLTLSNLDELSTEIFNLDEPSKKEANIGGIWGGIHIVSQQNQWWSSLFFNRVSKCIVLDYNYGLSS